MLAKKCDRCGKLYEHYDKVGDERQNGFSTIYMNYCGGRDRIVADHDLCKDCMESLIKWFDEKGGNENDKD